MSFRRRASAPSGGIQSGDGHVTLLPSNEATGLLSSTGIQGTQQGLRGVGFSSVVEMASFEATLKEEIDKVSNDSLHHTFRIIASSPSAPSYSNGITTL